MARLVAAECPSCGAGVRLEEGRGWITCDYCSARVLIELPAPTDASRSISAQPAAPQRPANPEAAWREWVAQLEQQVGYGEQALQQARAALASHRTKKRPNLALGDPLFSALTIIFGIVLYPIALILASGHAELHLGFELEPAYACAATALGFPVLVLVPLLLIGGRAERRKLDAEDARLTGHVAEKERMLCQMQWRTAEAPFVRTTEPRHQPAPSRRMKRGGRAFLRNA